MIDHEDIAVERTMQLVHECLKELKAEPTAHDHCVSDLRPIVSRTAATLLAPRLHIRPDAADPLTQLLRYVANESDWRLHYVPPPAQGAALSDHYRSGVDLETADGSRFDVWVFLVNARIGLTPPRINP